MKALIARGAVVILALAALVTTPAAATVHAATTTPPLPTLAQLESAIATSVNIKASPNLNTTVPPLAKVSVPGNPPVAVPAGSKFPWSCYPDSAGLEPPSDALTACAWGDVTSNRVVLLTGDSQAASWLAALNVAGEDLHFRVVFIGEPGCAPWGDPNPSSYVIFGTVTVASCNVFRLNVLSLARTLHPDLVLLDGRAYPKGSDEDVKANLSDFESRVTTIVSDYKSVTSRVALLGPVPFYNHLTFYGKTPAYCLAYASPLTSCEYSPTQMIDPIALAGEEHVAKSEKETFVSTQKFFCSATRCALFVKYDGANRLVYLDQYHMNRWYSAWIGRALAQTLSPLLP